MPKNDGLSASLDLLILKSLERTPNHGFGISQHMQEATGGLIDVEEGSLYPALHRLEKEGHLEAGWELTPNKRRARLYRITPRGKKRLTEAIENWNRVEQGVKRLLRFA